MGDLRFWEELRPGTTGELILAVDIPSGENDVNFRELVPLLDTQHTVWRALEQTDVPLAADGLAAYVEPWADAVRDAGLPVGAVLGHRVGSVLAGALAEALGADGRRPPCMLFDPELVDTEWVVELAGVSDGFAPEADRTAGSWPDDPAALAVRLRSVVLSGVDRPGTRNRAAAENLHRAAHRLSVLALAETYDVLPVWSRCTALSSSDPGNGLNRTRAALLLPEAGFVAREIALRHDHVEMFTSPAVARTASELLAVLE
ncbi:hypothetical protein [Streptomyces sp. NBC_00076]|uniref:hypothetical protein n=1 Tax=Streptomyces sp. NBC_00076 TaxID=2975642 RepID=UPI003253267C